MVENSLGVYRSLHQLSRSFNFDDQESDQSCHMNSILRRVEMLLREWRVPKERRRPTTDEDIGVWAVDS